MPLFPLSSASIASSADLPAALPFAFAPSDRCQKLTSNASVEQELELRKCVPHAACRSLSSTCSGPGEHTDGAELRVFGSASRISKESGKLASH